MHLGRAVVAQHTKAQPFAGDVTQLLLDGLDRGRQIGGRGQLDREQAGEPAHRAGQVKRVEQVFAAVAFELNQRCRITGPVAQRAGQCGQQQVIDLSAIRRGRLLQQLTGVFAVQPQADHLTMTQGLAAPGAGLGQLRADTLQLGLPPRRFSQQSVAVGVGTESAGPVLQGTGFFRQRLPGVRRLQVFKQDTPRHAIDHQVMNHQQQALACVLVVDQHRAQQRAVMQRQAALGFVTQGLQCLIALHLCGPQQIGGGRAVERHITRRPLPLDFTELQAQRIVLGQHLLHSGLQA